MIEDIKPIIDQLTSEYKIVQDKIDKIAGFRFTVRGWTITLLTGAIVAVASARIASTLLLALVFGFIILLVSLFSWMEQQQDRLQALFADRAYDIEVELRHLLKLSRGSPFPGTATSSPQIAQLLKQESTVRHSRWHRARTYADRHFYSIQIVVAALSISLLIAGRSKFNQASGTESKPQLILIQTMTTQIDSTAKGGVTDSDSKAKRTKAAEPQR